MFRLYTDLRSAGIGSGRMDTVAAAGGGVAAQATPAGRPEARRSPRTRMMRAAQVAFRGAVLDCVLVDASPEGAQVFLEAPADVPDLAELRFLPGGEGQPVRCR